MLLKGTPVSGGGVVGPLVVYSPFYAQVREETIEASLVAEHLQLFEAAKAAALEELAALYARMRQTDPERAKIFLAQMDILRDETIAAGVYEAIREEHRAVNWAIQKAFAQVIALFNNSPEALVRERAADVLDVQSRLLRIRHYLPEQSLALLRAPAVVAARDLLPSETAQLDRKKVLALLTEAGGPTSHTAILARSAGIPAVVGIAGLLRHARTGEVAAVDAVGGEVTLAPTEAEAEAVRKTIALYAERQRQEESYLALPAQTADGVRIRVGLNIGSGRERDLAGAAYADMVGLFRTEFLFFGRKSLPTEEEQFDAYRAVLEAYAPRPVLLRTLDVGGDKQLPGLPLPPEENPVLGVRALRLSLSHPALFKTQLRAALRASAFGALWLMLPMVASLAEYRRAKALVEATAAELAAEGHPTAPYKLGVMIETPAIALMADLVAAEVDFASIGTNDLCQYLLAADRMNPAVSAYYDSCPPALFRLAAQVARAFDAAKKPLSVCGEMGGDPAVAPLLVGLGLRSLSMAAASVGPVKHALARFSLPQLQALAAQAQQMATGEEVRALLREAQT